VGGLGGKVGRDVTNSYATGDVTVQDGNKVGGLVGEIVDDSDANVTNSYATGDVTLEDGLGGVGGLVGSNTRGGGDITNSYATGDVTATNSKRVGGLFGTNRYSSIDNSYATGEVEGDSTVGGLVGGSRRSSIDNSYATGNVTASSDNAGGLVGNGYRDRINNTYSTSNISGDEYVGGLVGGGRDLSDVRVSNSFHAGQVEGNDNTNNIIHKRAAGSVSDSYWDEDKSNVDGNGRGTRGRPLSTEEMTGSDAKDNMDLDFNETWRTTDSYPELQAEE